MSTLCSEIHELMNSLPRYSWPFDNERLPGNGLIILFEKGETSHGKDRIVMIGSHTSENGLRSRLEEHFIIENKDRSILRKNIGRCILNRRHDSYAGIWEICMIPRDNREEYAHLLNEEYQQSIEEEVSRYMKENLSFSVIGVNDKNKRSELKYKLAASIYQCDECKPSNNWLGLNSPKEIIRESGLWQEKGLNGQYVEIGELEHNIEGCFR